MIKNGGKSVISIIANSKLVLYVKKAGITLWQLVTSCFAQGYWINTERWTNNSGWKN